MISEQKNPQVIQTFMRHAAARKWALLGVQVLATVVGLSSLLVLPKQYRSTTIIRVEKEKVINPLTRGLAVSSEMEERLRTLRQEILTLDYMEKIVTRLKLMGAAATPVEHSAMLRKMISNTKIDMNQREADTFQISFVGEEPTQVRDVTNLLSGMFIENSLAYKESEAGTAFEFLKEQLEVYRKKLEESEAALRAFEEKHVEELPAARNTNQARLDVMRTSLDEVRNSLRQAKIQKELLLQRILGEVPTTKSTSDGSTMVVNPLQAQLKEKEEQLRQLLKNFSEGYPDVIALKSEIEAMKKDLAKRPVVPVGEVVAVAPTTVQQTLLDQLARQEMEIGTLSTREVQLESEIARYYKKVQAIPQVEQELTRLKRDYDVNNDIYDNFLRRVEEARVSQELEVAKKGEVFRILQAADLPLVPYKPSRLNILLMSIGAGLALNAALLYFLAMADTSFSGIRDVQGYLGMKVLGGIPRWTNRREQIRHSISWGLFAVIMGIYVCALLSFVFWEKITSLLLGGR